jgi:hypothetical protein
MQKANYGSLGLVAIIAPASVILLIILAFGEWNSKKESSVG